jgi:hypothetical protein
MTLAGYGPILTELLSAFEIERSAIESNSLASFARELAARCEDLQDPVVWPVGAPAERLAGAASVLSTFPMSVWDRHSRVDNRSVLVVTVADVTGLALTDAARHARLLGATDVHACGISVGNLPIDGVRSFTWLTRQASRPRAA